MIAAIVAEIVRDLRCIRHIGLFRIDLAVENAQRAALEAVAAILAEIIEMRTEIVLQRLAILRTALGAAHGVQRELESLEAQGLQEVDGDEDNLRVHHRVLLPQRLNAELMELAHTASLWTIVAEHGADIEQLHQRAVAIELVLQVGAHRRGRVLRTQCDAAATAILERIHLLVHDVGAIADAALEELRMLEHRRADLLITVAVAEVADLPFHIVPLADAVGQDVLGAAWGIG